MREAKADSLFARQVTTQERAAIAAEVGDLALDPPAPWRTGRAHHLAASLFLESISWSLRAVEHADAGAAAPAKFDGPRRGAELEQAIENHQALLIEAAEGRDGLDRLRRWAASREFESTAEAADDVEIAARALRRTAHNLLAHLHPARPRTARLMRQRVVRTGSAALALVLLLLAAFFCGDYLERRADLSADKPWRASSAYEMVCASPQRRCGDKDYFFHTQEEENPWLELDLQAAVQVSGVRVINRRDCCAERSVPLVVELSLDQHTWREVARTTEPFVSWRARFPAQQARWVRLRVPRRSLLHLRDVRVFP